MENKQTPSKKKLLSIQEEKLNNPVDCDFNSGAAAHTSNKRLLLDPEKPQPKPGKQKPSQRVLVTIRPRAPAIKTIFLAEKSRFYSRKETDRSKSILAIGDHLSFTSNCDEERSCSASPSPGDIDKKQSKGQRTYAKYYNIDNFVDIQSQVDNPPQKPNVYKTKLEPSECYAHTQPQASLINHHKLNQSLKKSSNFTSPPYIVANSSDNRHPPASISRLNKRINLLQRKVRKQEMVLGAIDPYHSTSSSDEGSRENIMRGRSGAARPGCSCINNYSHIPEPSAFQRYAQQSAPLQSAPLSPNKGTTIEKEHNSEQYARDFTTYDGITARGRRQCASATCKRDEAGSGKAAERVIKLRHKLNPVRDYRLMDTVHYLAQGEFAPRNDGIKLTPSREAVLSDIIWEDVCRTHWPTARLGRRHGQQERVNTRCELQRLIDSLLRERVAHVERRRRRHYRIVKLNHRHENSAGPVGKTGDIIVASHKHKHPDDDDDVGHNASGAMVTSKRWPESMQRHRSHDRLLSPEVGKRRRVVQEECTPGPSYAVPRAPARREPTCCYHTAGPSTQLDRPYKTPHRENIKEKISSSSTASSERQRSKNPRFVVKKDPSRRKYHQKEEVNLEHFILLPTLVVRTPSNVKRQKKFNELYHRILNQLGTDENNAPKNDGASHYSHRNCNKNDSGTSMNR